MGIGFAEIYAATLTELVATPIEPGDLTLSDQQEKQVALQNLTAGCERLNIGIDLELTNGVSEHFAAQMRGQCYSNGLIVKWGSVEFLVVSFEYRSPLEGSELYKARLGEDQRWRTVPSGLTREDTYKLGWKIQLPEYTIPPDADITSISLVIIDKERHPKIWLF